MKSRIKSVGLLVLAATALVALVGCNGDGGGGGNAPSDPKGLILEDASTVAVANIGAMLRSEDIPLGMLDDDEDPEDFKDDWRDEWEDRSRSLGTDPDAATHEIEVSGAGGYYITKGEFDFAAIKNELEDDGFDDATYRDREIWEHERGSAVALFENVGTFVYGSTDTVKEVLKALARGEGFMTSSADLRRALDKADSGALSVAAQSNCSLAFDSQLNGCEATAIAFTGGDEDSVQITGVVVFSSERRAESGMDDIEDEIEDDDSIDADVEEIKVEGDLVIYKMTLYE